MGIKLSTIAGVTLGLLIVGVAIVLDMYYRPLVRSHTVVHVVMKCTTWPFTFAFDTMTGLERFTYIPTRLFTPWRLLCVAHAFVIQMLVYGLTFRWMYVGGARRWKPRTHATKDDAT